VSEVLRREVRTMPVFDLHTHLFPAEFGSLCHYGMVPLLNYHYLVAEYFRVTDESPDAYWSRGEVEQAERIWTALFVDRAPLSEATRGIVTTLHRLGLAPRGQSFVALQQWWAEQTPAVHLTKVFKLAGVEQVGMTNQPFDKVERGVWERGVTIDPRFAPCLRLDPLLLEWPQVVPMMQRWGYAMTEKLTPKTIAEVRRFLREETARMQPLYLMVSLPPDFEYPTPTPSTVLLEQAILPHCCEAGLAFAMMAGVKRGVNPALLMAGDGVGMCDLAVYERLLRAHPENYFMMTALARENQHGLAVLARKFARLHLFGCWWFLNVPDLIEETITMRLELLGTTFTAQHSDCRVIEQLLYKWDHSRDILANILIDKYLDLAKAGWLATRSEIRAEVQQLLGGAAREFLQRAGRSR
jgi:hypothetical protein